jgi:cytochrome c oxidase subunit IV
MLESLLFVDGNTDISSDNKKCMSYLYDWFALKSLMRFCYHVFLLVRKIDILLD